LNRRKWVRGTLTNGWIWNFLFLEMNDERNRGKWWTSMKIHMVGKSVGWEENLEGEQIAHLVAH
jgi:hypothetical protein